MNKEVHSVLHHYSTELSRQSNNHNDQQLNHNTNTVTQKLSSLINTQERNQLDMSINDIIHQMIIDHKMIDSIKPEVVAKYEARASELSETIDKLKDNNYDEVVEDNIHPIIGTKVISDDVAVERTAIGIQKLESVMQYMRFALYSESEGRLGIADPAFCNSVRDKCNQTTNSRVCKKPICLLLKSLI